MPAASVAFSIAFASAFCFDFVINGIRVSDVIAYVFMLIGVLLSAPQMRLGILALASMPIFGVYAVYGILELAKVTSAMVLWFNVALFIVASSSVFHVPVSVIKMVIGVHILLFIVQFVSFYVIGHELNFHLITDIEPRLTSSIFRAAGLYYEPAMYSLSMFMLILLLPGNVSRPSILGIMGIATMLASVSLLGFFLACLLLLRIIVRRPLHAMIALAAIAFLTLPYLSLSQNRQFVANRLGVLEDDASAQGRYGGLADVGQNRAPLNVLMGNGLGTNFEAMGSSGISASITYIGLLGIATLVALLMWPGGNRVDRAIAVVGIAVSAPIFSYAVFPIWLASVVRSTEARVYQPQKQVLLTAVSRSFQLPK